MENTISICQRYDIINKIVKSKKIILTLLLIFILIKKK